MPEPSGDSYSGPYSGPSYFDRRRDEMAAAGNYKNGDFSGKYANILQTLTVVAIAVGGIYAAIIMPLHEQLIEVKADLARVSSGDIQNLEKTSDFFIAQMKGKITREEHEEFKLREDKTIDGVKSELQSAKSEIAYLRDNQVTRAEQVNHWDQQKENLTEARKQIDDLRKDFGGQYTVSQKLLDIQKQLDDMRASSATSHVQLNSPSPTITVPSR